MTRDDLSAGCIRPALASIFVGLAFGLLAVLVMSTDARTYEGMYQCYFMPLLLFTGLAFIGITMTDRSDRPAPVMHGYAAIAEVYPFITTANGKHGFLIETVSKEKWQQACKYLVEHEYHFTETTMRKVGIKAEFEKFRDELLELKLIEWKDPRAYTNKDYRMQGLTIPPSRRATIRYNAR